jgi:hypothetical protein
MLCVCIYIYIYIYFYSKWGEGEIFICCMFELIRFLSISMSCRELMLTVKLLAQCNTFVWTYKNKKFDNNDIDIHLIISMLHYQMSIVIALLA